MSGIITAIIFPSETRCEFPNSISELETGCGMAVVDRKNGRNWNVIEKKFIGDFEVRDVGSSAFSSIQEIKKRRVKTLF